MALTPEEARRLQELESMGSSQSPLPPTGRTVPNPSILQSLAIAGRRASAPPVVKPLSLNPADMVSTMAKATARSMIPIPPLTGNFSPGQVGLGNVAERAGTMVSNAVTPAAVEMSTNNPISRRFPRASASVALPALGAIELTKGMLKPSEMAQNIGADAIGGIVAPSVGSGALKLAGKVGKTALNVPEEAVRVAAKHPEVLEEGFSNPDRISSITAQLKRGIEDMKAAAQKTYESVLEKLGKPGVKKVNGHPVIQALDDIQKDLGIQRLKTKAGQPIQFAGVRGSGQKVGTDEIGKFTELYNKIKQDTPEGLPTQLSRKISAVDLHNERKLIDQYAEHSNTSPILRGKLREVRKKLDEMIRTNYPEIKAADKQYVKFIRTAKTVERRTGVKPGEYSPITEGNEARVGSLSRGFFDKGRQSYRKGLEGATKNMGKPGISNEMLKVGSAEKLDPGPLLNSFALSPSSIGKRALRYGIKTGGELAKRFTQFKGTLATALAASKAGRSGAKK